MSTNIPDQNDFFTEKLYRKLIEIQKELLILRLKVASLTSELEDQINVRKSIEEKVLYVKKIF